MSHLSGDTSWPLGSEWDNLIKDGLDYMELLAIITGEIC